MKGMHIAIFGGTFSPPHKGHSYLAKTAYDALKPDLMLIVPTGIPPHKQTRPGSPTAGERYEMARLAFAGLENTVVSDIETASREVSYTHKTVAQLMEQYPQARFTLVMGSDMFMTVHMWRNAQWLLENVSLCVLERYTGGEHNLQQQADKLHSEFGTQVTMVPVEAFELASTQLRELLPKGEGAEYLQPEVLRYILRKRLFDARPNADWLRANALRQLDNYRLVHTLGCEYEAVRLAAHWGADVHKARLAAILHDCTKAIDYDGQLKICAEYGITLHGMGKEHYKLLHAVTGAAVAGGEYAVDEDIVSAIRWHTTGRPDMTILEKVIYIADFIEPGRDFPGVEKVRELAYRDLDAALLAGFDLCIQEVRAGGAVPHGDTIAAMEYILAAQNR